MARAAARQVRQKSNNDSIAAGGNVTTMPLPDAAHTELSVEALIRRLVSQIHAPQFPPDNDKQTLLDIEVEDVRCILVRKLKPQIPHNRLSLSPREAEIARMVALGYPNKTIAGVLEISACTVGTYIRRMFAKCGVGTRAAMIATLSDAGLLPHPSRLK